MSYVEIKFTGDARKDKISFDNALKEFKKQVKKSNILNEYRQKQEYMSPSKYKKFRKNEAIKKRKREERKTEWAEHKFNKNF